VSESLSDSESDANLDYGGKNKATKRLQKGSSKVVKKRKAAPVCVNNDDADDIASFLTTGINRPPKPAAAASALKTSPSLPTYSQYSAHSQCSPSSPRPTPAHSTPSGPPHGTAGHLPTHMLITPSPRHGGGAGGIARPDSEATAKSTPPPAVVNRIPLPEGVTGLGSHDHNGWTWLKPENRKDREGRKVDHPDYNPRTIHIPPAVIKAQTPAMQQWFEIKQDYFDTVLFFKVRLYLYIVGLSSCCEILL
jgi:hypothetical protein